MADKHGGFAGKVLQVDLTHNKVKRTTIDLDLARQFLGGLGLTIKLAHDRIAVGTSAYSPSNPIVLGAGPLVGTDLPSTSRVYAVTKLPTSETVGWCGAGGVNFGYLLKNTGYDHVIIEGRAEQPSFLKIVDDQVELCDAQDLWGKGIEQTCEALWRSFRKPLGVLAIGQAGEHLSTFSMAFIDRMATLGRGGFGAVMGSKNLKAIVVRGNRGISVADSGRYKSIRDDFLKNIKDYRYLKEWQDLGLMKAFPHVPVETYHEIKKRRVACVSCPIGCKDVVEIQNGPHAGFVTCSSSALNLLTPLMYGFKDYREAIKLTATLDMYGLDMFEFLSLMKFTKNLSDNGIIAKSEIEPDIIPDSLESMENWARKISFREGLGQILADGFKGVLQTCGQQVLNYAPAIIKGMHPYSGPGSALPWDLFGTMELGQMLEPRGPHVGSGGSPTYFAKRPLEVFPRHLDRMGASESEIERILTGGQTPDERTELKIGGLLKYSHRWFTILGSLGICARGQINRFYSAALCARLYQAVTGISIDLDKLRKRADRVWTLYRMINIKEEAGRKENAIPRQWVQDGGFKDYFSEEYLSQQDIYRMIQEYYEEQGWDKNTGIPGPQLLHRLDLE